MSESSDGTKQTWTPDAKPNYEIGQIITCYHDPNDVKQKALREDVEVEKVCFYHYYFLWHFHGARCQISEVQNVIHGQGTYDFTYPFSEPTTYSSRINFTVL